MVIYQLRIPIDQEAWNAVRTKMLGPPLRFAGGEAVTSSTISRAFCPVEQWKQSPSASADRSSSLSSSSGIVVRSENERDDWWGAPPSAVG